MALRSAPVFYNQLLRYFVVGGVVGISAVFLRQAIAYVLPGVSTFYYVLSIVIIYGIAVVFSFYFQHLFTFDRNRVKKSTRIFVTYVAIALIGCLCTVTLSAFFRYLMNSGQLFSSELIDSSAFILGSLISALLTFALNKKYVFQITHRY